MSLQVKCGLAIEISHFVVMKAKQWRSYETPTGN
jgi:hypothetical protein